MRESEGGRVSKAIKTHTLFGRYEAIDAVNTMEPLIPSLMNARAATLAV
jgi:hypothetical protein